MKLPGNDCLLFIVEFHCMLHFSRLAKMKLPGNGCFILCIPYHAKGFPIDE